MDSVNYTHKKQTDMGGVVNITSGYIGLPSLCDQNKTGKWTDTRSLGELWETQARPEVLNVWEQKPDLMRKSLQDSCPPNPRESHQGHWGRPFSSRISALQMARWATTLPPCLKPHTSATTRLADVQESRVYFLTLVIFTSILHGHAMLQSELPSVHEETGPNVSCIG